jgi:hypothetical protein
VRTSSLNAGGRLSAASVGISSGRARIAAASWAALAVQVHPEAPRGADRCVELAPGGQAERKIGVSALVEVPARASAEMRPEHPRHLIALQRGRFRAQQPAVHPEDRRHPGDQKQIAGALLDHLDQEAVERFALLDTGLRGAVEKRGRRWVFRPQGCGAGGGLFVRLGRGGLAVELADEMVELRIEDAFRHAFSLPRIIRKSRLRRRLSTFASASVLILDR